MEINPNIAHTTERNASLLGNDAPREDIELARGLTAEINNVRPAHDSLYPLLRDNMILDSGWGTVRTLEDFIKSLSTKNDSEAIYSLNYIARLMREQGELSQEIRSLSVIKNNPIMNKEDIVPGDEWKIDAGLQNEFIINKYSLQAANPQNKEAIDSMNIRIQEINEDIREMYNEFERYYPAHADELSKNLYRNSLNENRTN
jgi:hypothetical protein